MFCFGQRQVGGALEDWRSTIGTRQADRTIQRERGELCKTDESKDSKQLK